MDLAYLHLWAGRKGIDHALGTRLGRNLTRPSDAGCQESDEESLLEYSRWPAACPTHETPLASTNVACRGFSSRRMRSRHQALRKGRTRGRAAAHPRRGNPGTQVRRKHRFGFQPPALGGSRGAPPLLTFVQLTGGLAFLIFCLRRHISWPARSALLLLAAGAFGNGLDRLFRGHVVDFIHLTHWPVFNVADVYITVGGILLLLKLRPVRNWH